MLMDVGFAQCSGKQGREGFFSVIVHTRHGSDHRLRTKVRRGGAHLWFLGDSEAGGPFEFEASEGYITRLKKFSGKKNPCYSFIVKL